MSEGWRADPPPAMISGRPVVGWTTHMREALRVLERLAELGALDDAQFERCTAQLTHAVPDPEQWVLFSVDLEQPRNASLAEISFWIHRLQALAGSKPRSPDAGASLSPDEESRLRLWLEAVRASVIEAWPEVALASTLGRRRDLLLSLLDGSGSPDSPAAELDASRRAAVDRVAYEIGRRIRRPEECAEALCSALLGCSEDFLRDVLLVDEAAPEARPAPPARRNDG